MPAEMGSPIQVITLEGNAESPMNRKQSKTVFPVSVPELPEPQLSPANDGLDDPSLYINREFSWLEFNRRVLEEAKDTSVPLLERLKFVSIFYSNLDEFFMVRVASLKEKIANGILTGSGGDKLKPRDQFDTVSRIAHEMLAEAMLCLRKDILVPLSAEGIQIIKRKELTPEERSYIDAMFERDIFPVLTPLAIDPSHPFPHLLNRSLNLAIRLTRPKVNRPLFAVVQVPAVLPRFVQLPQRQGHQFLPLESVIRKYLPKLFPGMEICDSYTFRVTRDSEIDLDDYEEIKDLIETIERQLRERRRGNATRLEVEEGTPRELVDYLRESLDLEEGDVYHVDGPLELKGLMEIYDIKGYEHLRDPDFVQRAIPAIARAKNLWSAIREKDILLHHPYDSFKPVVDFISGAADDPNVLAIKQTLYRTSSESPIIRALQRAADRGKQVTALVELQARLDEERNIVWARELEKAGVHVVYGFVGVKTHCKAALVVRRDDDRIRRYVHLATGNYNPQTARLYTDLGIFTCNEDIADDVSLLFNYLTGYSQLPTWKKLIVAPSRMRQFIIESIEAEGALGAKGRIVAKLNALLEPEVIRALYRASRNGAQIELICRGICGLRPGLPGLSENIRVLSVVDRFLEHSRLFYFGNNGDPKIYAGSADWMDRNLIRRIEVLFPIEDPRLKPRVIQLLNISRNDTIKARYLRSDGSWHRVQPRQGIVPLRSQQYFLDMASARDQATDLQPPLDSLVPIDQPLPSLEG